MESKIDLQVTDRDGTTLVTYTSDNAVPLLLVAPDLTNSEYLQAFSYGDFDGLIDAIDAAIASVATRLVRHGAEPAAVFNMLAIMVRDALDTENSVEVLSDYED